MVRTLAMRSSCVVMVLVHAVYAVHAGKSVKPSKTGRGATAARTSRNPDADGEGRSVLVLPPLDPARLVTDARRQVGVTRGYDPEYRVIGFPGGDVDLSTGVCCDVVIRAMRRQNVDLQVAVNADMRRSFSAYPKEWGLRSPDRNIDHRRVPNLERFFTRQGWRIALTNREEDFLPGDIVTWTVANSLPHIGFVSDRKAEGSGRRLVIHNIGRGVQEEDILFEFPRRGHFRVPIGPPHE